MEASLANEGLQHRLVIFNTTILIAIRNVEEQIGNAHFNSDLVSFNKSISCLFIPFLNINIIVRFFFLQSIGGTSVKNFKDRILFKVFHYSIGILYTWEGQPKEQEERR